MFTDYCTGNPFVNLNFKTWRNILFDISIFLMAVDSYYCIMLTAIAEQVIKQHIDVICTYPYKQQNEVTNGLLRDEKLACLLASAVTVDLTALLNRSYINGKNSITPTELTLRNKLKLSGMRTREVPLH
jgi:hypothetical protein